jgi:RNA polymerase sigma-70 factor (ECF subfamily)
VGLEILDEVSSNRDVDDARKADLRDLHDAMAQLSAQDQEILLLSEFGGFDTAALAHMLGIAPGTIGSRTHRALARLRELMKE